MRVSPAQARILGLIYMLLSALPTPGHADSPTDAIHAAAKAAELHYEDPLQVKITKALRLLNDEHYFQPTTKPRRLSPPFDLPYHLDSLRSPAQILGQKIGGGCGSAALAFAALLEAAGVSDDDIRVVGAVVNDDYSTLCQRAGQPRARSARTGASGHVFVLVREPGRGWILINTTDGSIGTGEASMPSPEALAAELSRRPVPVPRVVYRTMLEIPEVRPIFESGLTIFAVWRLADYPRHTFEDRLNLVASGQISDSRCRYDSKDVFAAELRERLSSAPTSPLQSCTNR